MKKECRIMFFSKFKMCYRGEFIFERLITNPIGAAREMAVQLANAFGIDAILGR